MQQGAWCFSWTSSRYTNLDCTLFWNILNIFEHIWKLFGNSASVEYLKIFEGFLFCSLWHFWQAGWNCPDLPHVPFFQLLCTLSTEREICFRSDRYRLETAGPTGFEIVTRWQDMVGDTAIVLFLRGYVSGVSARLSWYWSTQMLQVCQYAPFYIP